MWVKGSTEYNFVGGLFNDMCIRCIQYDPTIFLYKFAASQERIGLGREDLCVGCLCGNPIEWDNAGGYLVDSFAVVNNYLDATIGRCFVTDGCVVFTVMSTRTTIQFPWLYV